VVVGAAVVVVVAMVVEVVELVVVLDGATVLVVDDVVVLTTDVVDDVDVVVPSSGRLMPSRSRSNCDLAPWMPMSTAATEGTASTATSRAYSTRVAPRSTGADRVRARRRMTP
jgi:hypothetical protein